MAELIEIVFEKVSSEALADILIEITEQGNLVENCVVNGENCRPDWKNANQILNLLKDNNGEFSLICLTRFLSIYNHKVSGCQIRVTRGHNFSDLEINFESDAFVSKDKVKLITDFMNFSFEFANKYQIENYYCGLEPAVDEETRFFTKEKVGPLNLATLL